MSILLTVLWATFVMWIVSMICITCRRSKQCIEVINNLNTNMADLCNIMKLTPKAVREHEDVLNSILRAQILMNKAIVTEYQKPNDEMVKLYNELIHQNKIMVDMTANMQEMAEAQKLLVEVVERMKKENPIQ